MPTNIENLIVKFLNKSATASDLDALAEWIEEPNNKTLFKEYVEVHYFTYYNIKDLNSQEITDSLLFSLHKEKSFIHKLKTNWFYKYAAVFLIGLTITTLVFNSDFSLTNKNNTDNQIITDNNSIIEPGTDKAILTLEDGSQVVLEEEKTFSKRNTNSNGKEIIYKKNNYKNTSSLKYNYLTIPRGGQFKITLSDGTKVWLNSDSQLKYPVNFIEGKTREVELVYGEAYFDVSSSLNHKGSKFLVTNQSQDVEVLGTQFNIKAYPKEHNIYTTLVEGKVTVNSANTTKHLIPSEQLVFNKKNFTSITKKIDIFSEISWKDGIFSFENKPLKEMMDVLARWYNIEIVLKNETIENEEFIGVLRKNQDITDILANIKNFGIIKNYEIYDKKIILK